MLISNLLRWHMPHMMAIDRKWAINFLASIFLFSLNQAMWRCAKIAMCRWHVQSCRSNLYLGTFTPPLLYVQLPCPWFAVSSLLHRIWHCPPVSTNFIIVVSHDFTDKLVRVCGLQRIEYLTKSGARETTVTKEVPDLVFGLATDTSFHTWKGTAFHGLLRGVLRIWFFREWSIYRIFLRKKMHRL